MWDESKCIEMSNAIARNEMEHKSFLRRLDELEHSTKKQNDILVTLQKQGDSIEVMAKTLSEVKMTVGSIDRRVDAIEREPADKWKKIAFEIVKYIILAAVGVAVGYAIKGA